MRPLSAITAPVLAQLYAERAQRLDNVEAELRRVVAAANEQNDRLSAGIGQQLKGKNGQ